MKKNFLINASRLSLVIFLGLALFAPINQSAKASTSCTDGTNTGICMGSSLCPSGSQITDQDGKCASDVICCKQTASSSCASGQGTCQSSCDSANRLSSGDQDCSTGVCCKKSSSSGGSGSGIALPSGTGLSELSVKEIIIVVLKWLIGVFLLLAIIAFVVTGIQFLASMGNSYGLAEKAKNNFQYALTALVVVGAGYIIILTIDYLLKGYSTTF